MTTTTNQSKPWKQGDAWVATVYCNPHELIEKGQLWVSPGPVDSLFRTTDTGETICLPQGTFVLVVDWEVTTESVMMTDDEPMEFTWLDATLLIAERVQKIRVDPDSWRKIFTRVTS